MAKLHKNFSVHVPRYVTLTPKSGLILQVRERQSKEQLAQLQRIVDELKQQVWQKDATIDELQQQIHQQVSSNSAH